jgi:putative Mn2+ efflux pump MntP
MKKNTITKGNTMKKKLIEFTTIVCAIIGTLALVGSAGAVETDQWIGAGALAMLGITMFILSLYSQELYKEQK